MKLTKIIATIGPSSDSEEMIERLIIAGVNIFRFNFKHGDVAWHSERIQRVNRVAKKLNRSIGTLIDLQGPEIRIRMNSSHLDILEGDVVTLHQELPKTNELGFTISHPSIIPTLKKGDRIIADDGAFSFSVIKTGSLVTLRSDSGGRLKDHKSLNIPGGTFDFPLLIESDFDGLKLASLHEIDFIALSFVRSKEDIKTLRFEMEKFNVSGSVISKIETQLAIDNIDEIIEASDGIMIARGDLGVETPIERVPYYQKTIIQKCIQKGKAVITATQMLESMIEHPRPTRAEVSDVANSVYDWTDTTMLSAESAAGNYPLEAVTLMANTLSFYEQQVKNDIRTEMQIDISDESAMVAATAYDLYIQYDSHPEITNSLKGFIIFTQSGKSVQYLSRYRPRVPIFAFSPFKEVCDKLTLLYGVIPMLNTSESSNLVTLEQIVKAKNILTKQGFLLLDEQVIVVHGKAWSKGKGINTIRII